MEHLNDNSINHVFFEVIRLHYKRTFDLLEAYGVYPGQPPLLFALYSKDGQSQRELAEQIRLKPATVTIMLKRMEKSNLIEKKADKDDHRKSRIYLTEKGVEAYKNTKTVIDQLEEECLKNFTKEEKLLLRRLLLQIRDNLLEECKENN